MRSKWFLRLLGVAVAAAVVPAAAASAASAATLSGEGSTLIAPLEAEWAAAYDSAHPGTNITYASKGSGAGLKAIGAGQVDFGASDAPLSASTTACSGCVQMPWALTATGVGFHINGLKKLHLNGSVLAQIYLGKITNWDSKAIKKLQPKGVHLPNLKISVFFRSDGSGDTYAFTDYLSRVSGSFKNSVGSGTAVRFPVGTGAAGNSGMVSQLQVTNGSIAYVAVSYLAAQWPRAAALKNAAGNYETPNYGNIANAAQSQGGLGGNNEIHIVNPPKKYKIAYPISTYTYVILKPGQSNNGLAKDFVNYAINAGQSLGPRLDFVPIPGFVRSRDQSSLNGVS